MLPSFPTSPNPLPVLASVTSPQFLLYFFSSRRRHTRFDCAWSSDVCSSDLVCRITCRLTHFIANAECGRLDREPAIRARARSEERREGKECRSRWSPYH